MNICILSFILIIPIIPRGRGESVNIIGNCRADKNLEKICESYTFHIVKPMLSHFQIINVELDKLRTKDAEINELKEKLVREEGKVNELQSKVYLHQETIQNQNSNFHALNETYLQKRKEEVEKCQIKDAEIEELKEKLERKEAKINELNTQINETNVSNSHNILKIESLSEKQLNETQIRLQNLSKELESCRLKGDDDEPKEIDSCHESGVYKLKVFGWKSIKVLCDSNTAGTGWIVIQRRFDGNEDFFRDWAAYRNGFGSFHGDFFLGLENIHRLTSSGDYELYIRMESFNGAIHFAHYDDFKVNSEEEGYKLSSLGEFSGSGIYDQLRWHDGMKFTTFDRDNDNWSTANCADEAHGGWWYNACAASNLNGKYSTEPKTGLNTMYWDDYVALKTVKMLIRSKYT